MNTIIWIHIAGLFATGVWLIAVYAKENMDNKKKSSK